MFRNYFTNLKQLAYYFFTNLFFYDNMCYNHFRNQEGLYMKKFLCLILPLIILCGCQKTSKIQKNISTYFPFYQNKIPL